MKYNTHFDIMSLSSKLAITDVDLKGKRVLIRVSCSLLRPRPEIQVFGADRNQIAIRLISMSLLIVRSILLTISESLALFPPSNMPVSMELRPLF